MTESWSNCWCCTTLFAVYFVWILNTEKWCHMWLQNYDNATVLFICLFPTLATNIFFLANIMMKLKIIIGTILSSVLINFTLGFEQCDQNFNYCGHYLISRGYIDIKSQGLYRCNLDGEVSLMYDCTITTKLAHTGLCNYRQGHDDQCWEKPWHIGE